MSKIRNYLYHSFGNIFRCFSAFKIRVLCQKLVIIYATRAGATLGVLGFKIKSFTSKIRFRVLRQKFVIFCTTRAGAKLRVLGFKISVSRQKISHYLCHSCGSKFTRFSVSNHRLKLLMHYIIEI